MVQTPYGPFARAFEHLARVIDPVEMRAALRGAGGELTRLMPDLPVRVGELAAPSTADPDTERHRLHTAATDLLDAVGRQRPVLLVIEDAQWADRPTLLLLRHLMRAAGGPLLLLATFREEEVDMPEALAQTLADLRRSDDVVRLRVAGLSADEVIEFVERAGEARSGARSAGGGTRHQRPHRREPVPGVRILARAPRNQGRRSRRRADPAHASARDAGHARERS